MSATPRWFRAGLTAIAVLAPVAAVLLGAWTRPGPPGTPLKPAGGESPVPPDPRPAETLVRGGGEHALAGVLVDAQGAPVVAAEVQAFADADAADAQPQASARTGGTGDFELAGLTAGVYRVQVTGAGIFDAAVRLIDVPGDQLRLVVTRKADLRGRVTDGGAPSVGATVVAASSDGADRRQARTGKEGAFAFSNVPAGRYRVYAVHGARGAAAREVELPVDGPVDIALDDAALVVGRVVDGRGEGLVADVSLQPERDDEPPRRTRSDPDGRFRFEGVTAGRWSPTARRPGHVAGEALSFDAERVGELELVLVRGAIVSGVVVDAGGAAVEGASVSLFGTDEAQQPVAVAGAASQPVDSTFTGGLRLLARGELGVTVGPLPALPPPGVRTARAATADAAPIDATPIEVPDDLRPQLQTDSRGRFRFTGLRAGRYQVRAHHRGHAPRSAPEVAVGTGGHRRGVRLVLFGGTVVHGVVTDPGGPVAGATVSAQAGDELVAVTVSGPEGGYELGALVGPIELVVNAPRRSTATKKVDLGRSRQQERRRVDIELGRADASIAGRVVDHGGFDIGGARLEVVGQRERRAVSASAGQFEIAGLPPGAHELRVEANGYPPVIATARTGEPVTVSLRLGGGVDLQLIDRHTLSLLGSGTVIARGPRGAVVRAAIESGRAQLAPLAVGRWSIEVASAGYVAETAVVEVPAARLPGQTSVERQVRLARGATVAGIVRDRYGERVAGALVEVAGARARTDIDGAFRLEDVPAGDVVLEASKDGEGGEEALSLRPGDELVTLEIRFD